MVDLYEFYLIAIDDAATLEDLDALMFDCADDPGISASDFVKLTAYAKHVITSRGWIS